MSDRGSWNVLLSHPASSAGCEISDQRIRTCLTGQNSERDIPEEDGTLQGWPSACAWCRDPSPWWHGARIAIRSNSILIPEEDMWRTPLSGLPQGEAHGTREHHTPDDSISYPDMLSGSLTKVSKPCYSPCSAALRWCVRTPCLDIFAMDSQELSSISDCFGDQKTKT